MDRGRSNPTSWGNLRTGLRRASGLVASLSLLGLLACPAVIKVDQTSLQHATDLKTESLALMAKATSPPAAVAPEIAKLRLELKQALEYEQARGKANAPSVAQWQLLMDPEHDLLGGFLKKWETENKGQNDAFIKAKQKQVAQAFDEITRAENGKK